MTPCTSLAGPGMHESWTALFTWTTCVNAYSGRQLTISVPQLLLRTSRIYTS